jgi:hypothetical protein
VDLQGNELHISAVKLKERPTYFVANESMPEMLPW